jgi:hypothetical protein
MGNMRKRIEDYAAYKHSTAEEGVSYYVWLPSTLEKYTAPQLERLKQYFKKHDGVHITIGTEAITDLYKRVAKLEKRK